MSRFFSSPFLVFSSAILLRIGLIFYGLWQDANSPLKYTDIDYYVFTDAARFVSRGQSPYDRETYRYTPLLAWLLLPTTWSSTWFSFGKVLFAMGDIVAGWLIVLVLRSEQKMSMERALKFASIWLLNPMVATISTRGSSEGLLGVMVIALSWAVLQRRIVLAGALLGLGVHFKIYPFIYAPSIIWWMDEEHLGLPITPRPKDLLSKLKKFANKERITLTLSSLVVFMGLNGLMYTIYGPPFIQHTFLHHLSRLDHRHNFSPYNTLLYLVSSPTSTPSPTSSALTTLAFIPQLLLCCILLPFLAKHSLPCTLLAQTFAFVTFNKVCTSQYFLWYMVFLPFYLPSSSLLTNKAKGVGVLLAWVGVQGAWLGEGYELEFKGKSRFVAGGLWGAVGGLWAASLGFFWVNCWVLGIIVADIGALPVAPAGVKGGGKAKVRVKGKKITVK